ncbi:hypothetical protein [Krasilnikovia sp. M28-CT-15]|uniref:hypothetical protein n=1 Tax=Krasilnikovia sp. M28-CT-15 TaxID=3373540 RepID=UPI003875DE86
MSDDTTPAGSTPPPPQSRPAAAADEPTAAESAPFPPEAPPAPPQATPAPPYAAAVGAPPPREGGWRRITRTRVPLLLAGGLLLVGCVLGAGVTAVGALVVDHHGDHMRVDRYDRWDGPRHVRPGWDGPGWEGPDGPGWGEQDGRQQRPRFDRQPVPNAPGAPAVPNAPGAPAPAAPSAAPAPSAS